MKSVFTTGVVAPAESGGPEPAPPLSPGAGSGLNRRATGAAWLALVPVFAAKTSSSGNSLRLSFFWSALETPWDGAVRVRRVGCAVDCGQERLGGTTTQGS